MILKGSQRSGAKAFADHLLNQRDNDHVTVLEVRGFIADDLTGAFREAQAISKATHCTQYLFSLSLNPPEHHCASEAELRLAVDRAEAALGLTDQPRAIVIHEKEGRRHAHACWSRIDGTELKAIPLPHFKRKLMALSKELFLDHGWDLPDGLKAYGGRSPLNFTLDQWQQAKRQDQDPREIKQTLRQAWEQSDSLEGLTNALSERGYLLAKGDRRAVVVLDHEAQIYSLSRWSGIRAKEIKARIGDCDQLPSLDEARSDLKSRITGQMRSFICEVKNRHASEREPLLVEKAAMVAEQRKARHALLRSQQDQARKRALVRSAAFRRGMKGVWDWMTGKRAEMQRKHADQVKTEQTRDASERHQLVQRQMIERRELQQVFRGLRRKHASERSLLAKQIGQSLRQVRFGFGSGARDRSLNQGPELAIARPRHRNRDFSPDR